MLGFYRGGSGSRSIGEMMKVLSGPTVDQLRFDADRHEMLLREVVRDRLSAAPVPRSDDQMIVSYFFALRSMTLAKMADEIAYHSTSGTHASAARLAVGRMHRQGRRDRCLRRHRADGPVAHGLSAEDAVAARWPCDLVRRVARGGRGDHFDVYENQDAA